MVYKQFCCLVPPPALAETTHLAILTIPKKGTHTVLVLPFTGFYLIIHDKMNNNTNKKGCMENVAEFLKQ